MSTDLYRVVLTGVLTGEFEEDEARRAFAKAFKLSDTKLSALLSGKERIIKSDIAESVAMQLMIKVLECGYECYVQEMPEEGVEYEEKRSGSERRVRYRRGPRAGAIVPDRRLKIRRKRDVKYFQELIKLSADIPLPFSSYPKV